MKRLAVAVFGSMMASIAIGADWGPGIKSVEGDITYVDFDSIKNSTLNGEQVVGSWTKTKNKLKNSKDVKKEIAEYKAFSWYNCKEKTKTKATSVVLYSSNQSIIESNNYRVDGFYPIVPDSIDEGVFNITCSLAMWNEYFKIATDSNGLKDSYQLKSLANRYPYQANMLKGKEYEPQYLSDDEIKRLFPDYVNKRDDLNPL